jgi:hypothetical protein
VVRYILPCHGPGSEQSGASSISRLRAGILADNPGYERPAEFHRWHETMTATGRQVPGTEHRITATYGKNGVGYFFWLEE